MSKPKRSSGYQLCVHVGPRPAVGVPDTARFVELAPTASTAEAVLAALESAAVDPSDFRTEVLCSLECERDLALLVYVALVAYAQRRLDVVANGRIVEADRIDRLARNIVDAGKPESVPAQLQVGVVQHPVLHTVLFSANLSPVEASLIRYARRVRFAPAQDVSAAVTQLLVVAGIRARGTTDRLPYLVQGVEPEPDAESPLAVVGVCLDTLRSAALSIRRRVRSGDRRAIIPTQPASPRRSKLDDAAAVSIEDALRLLGGRQNPDSGLWHCPRPDRHNNGDANASMRTVKGLVRCYRCDGERVDSLRLAMDVLGLGPDDAAAWLLAAAAADASAGLDAIFS
jgi:hypothetical protein